MPEDDDLPGCTALELMVDMASTQARAEKDRAELVEKARSFADDARLALAAMVPEAVDVIAARLLGAPAEGGQGALKAGEFPKDERGVPVTREREEVAWEILSRIGVPRLRATAVAASMAAQTTTPAPLSPGWDPEEGGDESPLELDPASVDAQISAYLKGVSDHAKLRGEGSSG